jgi:UDP-2,4-diacetamido-2,4,6-trideoxy-beta-L-altropyranose hydrolase
MIKKKVVLIADGNTQIGLGHIYRCIAIAEMLEDTFICEFILGSQSNFKKIVPERFTTKHIPNEFQFENEHNWLKTNFDPQSTIIILDGYQFKSEYQKGIKHIGFKLVYIDDLCIEHMFADIVINHSPQFTPKQFKAEKYTKFYLGLEYVLLRQLFLNQAKQHNYSISAISSALITLGGSDENNITSKILDALLKIKEIETINIVIGAAYPHKQVLESKIINQSKKINIFSNLTGIEILTLMKESNIAFAPCSTTSLELIAINKPIFIGYSAENQKHLYNYLCNQNLIFDLGNLQQISTIEIERIVSDKIGNINEINKMLTLQQQVIDGLSGERINNLIKQLI